MSGDMFGVAHDFRTTHGEDAFAALAKMVFADADEDKSGTVDSQEIRTMLRKLGMVLSDEQALAVLNRYDTNGDGTLDQQEWFGLVSDLIDGSFDGGGAATTDDSSDEVLQLRAENRELKQRVERLEAQMSQIVERLGMPRMMPRLPSREMLAPSSLRMVSMVPDSRQVTSSAPGKELRKQCDVCLHSWVDKHGKDECPKCLSPLSMGGQYRRAPGEASTFKLKPGDAMESASGSCPRGGAHRWKFGKCSKCGKGEGKELAERNTGGECQKGGRHIFKFGKCVKCSAIEF